MKLIASAKRSFKTRPGRNEPSLAGRLHRDLDLGEVVLSGSSHDQIGASLADHAGDCDAASKPPKCRAYLRLIAVYSGSASHSAEESAMRLFKNMSRYARYLVVLSTAEVAAHFGCSFHHRADLLGVQKDHAGGEQGA
jgi:hypothetical protein